MWGEYMGRDEIINTLRNSKNEYADTLGIISLGVFGSVARGDAGSTSDVDVEVRLKKPDLFTLAGIKNELEERLHMSVDIVTYRESMNKLLKTRIDQEAVYV